MKFMSTLVYFASGEFKPEYEKLPFDDIYLIDFCNFKDNSQEENTNVNSEYEPLRIGKVTCLGMECLRAVDYLKSKNVKIDYYVALDDNGCFGQKLKCPLYATFLIGYVMQILNDEFVYITNLKKCYGDTDKSVIDLPYEITPILKGDSRYIDPKVFTTRGVRDVELFQMSKINSITDIAIDSKVKVSVIRDSIWNYYDELDLIVHSISDLERRSFFKEIPKVTTWNHIIEHEGIYCLYLLSEKVWKSKFEIDKDLDIIFAQCVKDKVNKIGFTPHGKRSYDIFAEKVKNYKEEYPKEILLFHLNKHNYKELKTKYGKENS
jgi:hypothetical protein